MNRRIFCGALAGFATASLTSSISAAADSDAKRRPRLLLRSSWQTVNIGDIAHTPGVLTLLEKHLPEVDVTLWPSKVDNGVEALLRKRFPKLAIVQTKEEIATAIEQADFLLHGSGPSLVAQRDVNRWRAETKKPFGVFGITLPNYPPNTPAVVAPVNQQTIELLSAARFVYFRDSVSLGLAKERGCTAPVMEFGPDGAFAVDLRNDAAAEKFLQQHDLQPGKFLCCIPRLRHTPYWLIKDQPFNKEKHARNEELKEHDHAPLRAAITAVVSETDFKILLCPEDQSQMAVGKEMVWDKLPAEVQKHVVWREKYWLTDEAVSTYLRSAGLFGLEMHSPIMCVGNGIPAVVGRFAEQTSKGFMWRDIGLGDWLFDFDREEEVRNYAATVLSLAKDPAAAQEKTAVARKLVAEKQRGMVTRLRKELGLPV